MPISPALRGIPLILALLDKNPKLRDGAEAQSLSRNMGNKAYTHLTGQVVAAYVQARLKPTHQLVGVARSHSLFVVTPLSRFREPCIWAFLSSLRNHLNSNPIPFLPFQVV